MDWVRQLSADLAIPGLSTYGVTDSGDLVNKLAVAVLITRVAQSLVHVCLVQSNSVASIRFAFFFVQIVAFFWLIGIIIARLA